MSRRPPLREVPKRRALREQAAGVLVSQRLAALLALAIVRWGYRLDLPPDLSRLPKVGRDPTAELRDAYAWAEVQAFSRLEDQDYCERFEQAVGVYDEILRRHLPHGGQGGDDVRAEVQRL